MSDEEKGYEVKDKRKIKMDENGEVQVEAEADSAPVTEQAEESSEREGTGLPTMDVYALLGSFIGVLAMNTWYWMGLLKNPSTGQLDRDLGQAKVAIDTIASLIQQLEGKVDASEWRDLQGLLSDLRINYVQQSAKG